MALPPPPHPPGRIHEPGWSGATFNRRGWHALDHLPTVPGGPFWVDWQILFRPLAFTRRVAQRCGPVARTVIGGQPHVLLLSASALESVLLDRDRVFSAQGGWSSLMGELFPRGLLLRDGDEHRHHRRLMLPAFRREVVDGFLARMVQPVQEAVDLWIQHGRLVELGLPVLRRLALSRAADLLLALRDGPEVDQAERDFALLVEAATALVRLPLIGRKYARGLQARGRLVAQLTSLTQARRRSPGEDLISQLIRTRDEQGCGLQDGEIVDHLVFLMMAAHDTTASALTSALAFLAQNPAWQTVLQDELKAQDPDQPLMARLAARRQMGGLIREVLRLNPPVAFLQRQTLKDTVIDGHPIPAGTLLSLVPLHVQRDPQWWSEPDRFDPTRHERAPAHAYAWTPFGGGAHLCLGLHLADAQLRLVLGELLSRARLSLPPNAPLRWRHAPTTHPVTAPALTLTRHR